MTQLRTLDHPKTQNCRSFQAMDKKKVILATVGVVFVAAVAVGIFLAVHFTAGNADDREDDDHEGDHRLTIVRHEIESKSFLLQDTGFRVSAVVDHTPHVQEVVGSKPAEFRAFDLFLAFQCHIGRVKKVWSQDNLKFKIES